VATPVFLRWCARQPSTVSRRNTLSRRLDRHAAIRRLQQQAAAAGIRMPRIHPHMLRHTFVTTMLHTGVSLRNMNPTHGFAERRMATNAPGCRTSSPLSHEHWSLSIASPMRRAAMDWARHTAYGGCWQERMPHSEPLRPAPAAVARTRATGSRYLD
jgi:hypothetical protein